MKNINKNILILALVALIAAVGIWWFANNTKSEIKLDAADQALVNPAAGNNSSNSLVETTPQQEGEVEVITEVITDADTGEVTEVEIEIEPVQIIERIEGRVDENGVDIAP